MSRIVRLPKSIYYDRFGDEVYLRNVDTHREYLFSGSIEEILHLLTYRPLAEEDLLDQLADQYDVEDVRQFREDMSSFLDQLCAEGILDCADGDAEDSLDVYERIQEYSVREHRLLSLTLELTYRCNERCIHCYVENAQTNGQPELELEDYKRLLDQARSMGCLQILLTGGEVTQKSCFLEVAEYAASLGMLVDIYSNGLSVSDACFDRIAALKPNSISYSLYGGTAAVHDSITQVPGSFERTLKCVLMTKCAGIDTFIKTVVMRENVSDMEELLKLGKRIGIEVATGFTILDSRSGASAQKHRLAAAQEYAEVMKLFADYGMKNDRTEPRDVRGRVCNAGQCSLSVDPYGNVMPCLSVHRPLGNIRTLSLQQIWDHSPELERIRGIRHCDLCRESESCAVSGHCDICMGRLDLDSPVVPPDVCMLAQAETEYFQSKGKEAKA